MKYYLLLITLLLTITNARGQENNDHIFPASVAAKPYIDFDSKGFIVNGKRTFLVSAGLEYARIPRQLWYDRLMRIKQAGFNCIEIYAIWNFHEEKESKFDFTGDRDLGKFLDLVKQLGMYAIVRVGPYYCAEWDNGGYPIWLKFKKGLSVREHNKPFERYVDRFFDHLLPIVFNRQINKGGAVILVQLENEHPKGWGTIMPDGYFKQLQTKALQMGLQVPYFFSGLHHASDPAGNGKLDDDTRPNPWFSTEFWSVWYSQYGAKPGDAALYDRRTWKIIAHGGNGYNYYMVHGGSNFGYTNNDEDAASYDYGAAIGQAGDLRPIYYSFKRAALFGRSFQNILENSTDATAKYAGTVSDTAIKVSARTSNVGDLVFLDNPGSAAVKVKLNGSNAILTVAPGEIYPLVHNFLLADGVMLDYANTRVFAITTQGNTTTIILDVEKGEPLSLRFSTAEPAITSLGFNINGKKIDLDMMMPAIDKPLEFSFTADRQTIRVLAMNREWTNRTYITGANGQPFIVSGANYVADVNKQSGQLKVTTEDPLVGTKPGKIWVYIEKEALLINIPALKINGQAEGIALNNWEAKAAPAGNATTGWLKSANPQPMGADGDVTPDAWYKTVLNVPSAGKYTLQVNGGGRGQAFIDGKPLVKWQLNDNEVSFDLKKGRHNLSVFAAHDGRDKLAAYIGPIDKVDSKGIFGAALLKKGGPFIKELDGWYFTKAAKKDDVQLGPPVFDTVQYKKYKIGADVFNLKEGYAWFYTTIPQQPAGTSGIKLLFKSVDENATVFINGKQVAHHDGWNQPFDVDITDATTLKKPIELALFIENYSNEGGIDQPVKINTIGNAQAITGWQLKGGPGDPFAATDWTKLAGKNAALAIPYFYRSSFKVDVTKGQTFIWRIDPKNLGHGAIWINGHNLGHYPEKLDMKSLYIPECWLNNGLNQVVIYDEDGKRPDEVKIVAEPAAGRLVKTLTADIKD